MAFYICTLTTRDYSSVWPCLVDMTQWKHGKSWEVKQMLIQELTLIIIILKWILLWRQYPKIQAQWRNKTKGLGILVIMYKAKSRQQMDGHAKKLRRIGNIKKLSFQMTAKWNYMSCWFFADGEWIPQSWCGNRESFRGDNRWAGLGSDLYPGKPTKCSFMCHLRKGDDPSYDFG